jgi:hypothetical protein
MPLNGAGLWSGRRSSLEWLTCRRAIEPRKAGWLATLVGFSWTRPEVHTLRASGPYGKRAGSRSSPVSLLPQNATRRAIGAAVSGQPGRAAGQPSRPPSPHSLEPAANASRGPKDAVERKREAKRAEARRYRA